MGGCVGGWVFQWVGLGHITKYQINLDLIEIIQFCLNMYDLLDILDIFLDILLKPPQPFMGLFSLYDFSIKYRSGLKNGDADGLSRRSVITENEVHSICNGILAQEPPRVGIIQVSKVQVVNWQRRQNADEAIKLIGSFVKMGRKPPYREQSSLPEETNSLLRDFDMLMVSDGVLYRKQQRDGQEVYQLILPKE